MTMKTALPAVLASLVVVAACSSQPAAPPAARTVLFFGDSLTAGYGLEPAQNYPALIHERTRERGWNVTVVNAGVSGNTSADGLARVQDVLDRTGKVDVFVLALGANDVLRRMDLGQMEENLGSILDRARSANPDVKLVVAGVDFGMVLGMLAGRGLDERFERVAEGRDAVLIPNLLKGVVHRPELNLPDGIHPNAEGAKRVAENVWEKLAGVLKP